MRKGDDDKWSWIEKLGCLSVVLVIFGLISLIPILRLDIIPLTCTLMVMLMGLHCLRLPFNAESFGQALLILPFCLMSAYGLIAMAFPIIMARYLTPQSWEWPVGSDSTVISLAHGKTAVALEGGSSRVQIYDADGQYLGGWFVYLDRPYRSSYVGSFSLLRNDQERGGRLDQESVQVYIGSSNEIIRYNLDGRIIGEKKEKLNYRDLSQTRPQPESHPVPWYKWPLISPEYAWILAAAGGIGLALINLLAVYMWKDNKDSQNRKEIRHRHTH